MIRLFDLFLSSFLIFFLSPLIFLVIIGSLIFIGFPPVFISRRVGQGGRLFKHYKVRSMKPGKTWGRSYFEQHRLNSYGRFIRRFHLDELPEIWHIFRGEMSFVGPRPLLPPFLEKFDTNLRERVPPGWSGLAQIKLARKGILYGPEQIKLDNLYIKRRSLFYNFRILCATLRAALGKNRKNLDPRANGYRRTFLKNVIQKK